MAAETNFHRLLKQKLEEVANKRKIDLATGVAKDYAQYRESVGYMLALVDVLNICEEIEREHDQR